MVVQDSEGQAASAAGRGPAAAPGKGPAPHGPHGRRYKHDLTHGPITKTLLVFSLPVLGGNVLQSLNGSVNQFWVSHTLGVSAITALANANLVMFLLLASIFGISMAANILVAQAVGAEDMPLVKKVMGTAVTFFMAMAALMAIVGYFLSPTILGWMNTPAVSRAEAIVYLRIIFLAMPFMCMFMFLQMAQRGAGDSKTPFYFMLLAVVLDSGLNPLLIRGIGPFPRLGIAGSATSTLIGQGVSLVCLIFTLYRMKSPLMLHWSERGLLKPDLRIADTLLMRGAPMAAQMFVMSSGAMVVIFLVNSYGAVTSAAYAAASQVWSYVQMPAMALGASISSMAAQNIGAERWDRVNKVALSGVLSSLAVTGAVVVVIYALGDLPLHIFLPAGTPAMPIARHVNQVILWSMTLFGVTFALSGIVRSTGAVWAPLAILFFSMWLIRLPFAMLLKPYWGPDAIWWSFPLGTVVSAALAGLYYRYGGWRKLHMLKLHHPWGAGPEPGAGVDIGLDEDCEEMPGPELGPEPASTPAA
jgi:putative MATE family efflux protein